MRMSYFDGAFLLAVWICAAGFGAGWWFALPGLQAAAVVTFLGVCVAGAVYVGVYEHRKLVGEILHALGLVTLIALYFVPGVGAVVAWGWDRRTKDDWR